MKKNIYMFYDNNYLRMTLLIEEQSVRCPECNGSIFNDRGVTKCSACGLIINDDNFVCLHETYYDEAQKESKKRTGLPISIMTTDINSNVYFRKSDIKRENISKEQSLTLHRIHKWDVRFNNQNKSILYAKSEIKRICSVFDISRIIEARSMFLYRKCSDLKIIRGRSIDGIIAGAIFYASREFNFPLSLDEVDSISEESKRNIMKCFTLIIRRLNLPYLPPLKMTFAISKYLSLFKVNKKKYQSHFLKVFKLYKQRFRISGKDPKGIFAGILYYFSREKNLFGKLTQKEIAEKIDVTEVTLRTRFKEIQELARIIKSQ